MSFRVLCIHIILSYSYDTSYFKFHLMRDDNICDIQYCIMSTYTVYTYYNPLCFDDVIYHWAPHISFTGQVKRSIVKRGTWTRDRKPYICPHIQTIHSSVNDVINLSQPLSISLVRWNSNISVSDRSRTISLHIYKRVVINSAIVIIR
jgi:hypothetical protein